MAEELDPRDVYEVFYVSEPGKRIMAWMRSEWYHRLSYVPGNVRGHTEFLEGQRSCVVELMSVAWKYLRPPLDGDAIKDNLPVTEIPYEFLSPLDNMDDFNL